MNLLTRQCPSCRTATDSRLFRESNVDEGRWTDASFSSRKIPEYMHFTLRTCSTCGLTYAAAVPTPEVINAAYRSAPFSAGRESRYAARTYISYLRDADVVPGTALDIGAGDGAFVRELLAYGFSDVIGIEPSEAPVLSAAEDVRPHLRRELFDGERFAANSFDLVTCFQTIEHVFEPRALLEAMYRVVKPGGTAFLVAHDLDALSARILGPKSPIFDIEHLQLFNRRSLHFVLEAAGFRDVRVFSIRNAYPLSYWLRLFPLPDGLKMRVLGALEHGFLRSLGRRVLALPAGNLGAFGRKNEA
jgi:SAM-dependent methyltransferase